MCWKGATMILSVSARFHAGDNVYVEVFIHVHLDSVQVLMCEVTGSENLSNSSEPKTSKSKTSRLRTSQPHVVLNTVYNKKSPLVPSLSETDNCGNCGCSAFSPISLLYGASRLDLKPEQANQRGKKVGVSRMFQCFD